MRSIMPMLALAAWAGSAQAQSGPMQVTQPWARATPGHGSTAAAYLTLTDHGAPDMLVGLATPVAAMAMLHETKLENGVARMTMLDRIELAPHTPLTFRPGALHVMLTGLRQPLKQGDSFPLTLTFAHAAPVTVTVPVLAPGAAGPDAPAGGHDMHAMPGMQMD